MILPTRAPLPAWFPLLRLFLSVLLLLTLLPSPRLALPSLAMILLRLFRHSPPLALLLIRSTRLLLSRWMPLLRRLPLDQLLRWSLRPLWLRWILTTRPKTAPSWKTWARWSGVRICS